MTRERLKAEIDSIIDTLPNETSWDDLMYWIYVRQKIEKGIAAADEGKVMSSGEIRSSLGVS